MTLMGETQTLRVKGRGLSRKVKFALAFLVVIGAIAYLAFMSFQGSAMYYLSVNEMLSQGPAIYDQEIRIMGKVVPGSVERDIKTSTLQFRAADDNNPSLMVPVIYRGVVPDTFKEERQVVLEGRYSAKGIFEAKTLFAKCPSKYEAEEPGTQ